MLEPEEQEQKEQEQEEVEGQRAEGRAEGRYTQQLSN